LDSVQLAPGSRYFLCDLNLTKGGGLQLLASACKALPVSEDNRKYSFAVEGVAGTPAVLLFRTSTAPKTVTLDGQIVGQTDYFKSDKLLWVRFENEARPRTLRIDLN
jgi:hypothetical protein